MAAPFASRTHTQQWVCSGTVREFFKIKRVASRREFAKYTVQSARVSAEVFEQMNNNEATCFSKKNAPGGSRTHISSFGG